MSLSFIGLRSYQVYKFITFKQINSYGLIVNLILTVGFYLLMWESIND